MVVVKCDNCKKEITAIMNDRIDNKLCEVTVQKKMTPPDEYIWSERVYHFCELCWAKIIGVINV